MFFFLLFLLNFFVVASVTPWSPVGKSTTFFNREELRKKERKKVSFSLFYEFRDNKKRNWLGVARGASSPVTEQFLLFLPDKNEQARLNMDTSLFFMGGGANVY